MKFFKKLSVPVILLTGLFTIALSVNAFKPTITEYGHTSITQKVISDNGYPVDFGGSGLVGLAQFQATLSGGSTITFSTEAAKHLVEGVQSNDWVSGSFGTPDVLGESGLAKEIEGEKWPRLSEQQTPIYKWKPGGFTKVQSCPRRRRLRRTDAVGNSGRTTGLVFYAAFASVGISKP